MVAARDKGACAVALTIGHKPVGGALVLHGTFKNGTFKAHFHRDRPGVPWAIGDEHTFSFPIWLTATISIDRLWRAEFARSRAGLGQHSPGTLT